MKPPPPIPATYGSVTPSVAAAATAASTASPPCRRSRSQEPAWASPSPRRAERSPRRAPRARRPVRRAEIAFARRIPCPERTAPNLRFEILADDAVDHTVDPLVVAPVRLAAHSFANEPGPLGVALRALVEAVDLELQPVVAEVVDQVPLEEARRLVGEAPAAEVGMHRERAEVGDPASAVRDLEAHQARALPVELDHEAAELLRLPL